MSPKAQDVCAFGVADRISIAVQYHRRAESAAHFMAVWGALCGLELQSLKKEQGHGGWQEFYAANIEDKLPLRTAQYYMQVAEGLKIKAKIEGGSIVFSPSQAERDAFMAKRGNRVTDATLFKLVGHFDRRFNAEVWRLLETAPSKLTDAQRERLAAAVESIADGETMGSLVEAYRLTKRATGSGSAGGYKPDPERVQVYLRAYHPALAGTLYADLPEEVQAAFRKWIAAGSTDEVQMALNFFAPILALHHDPELEQWERVIPASEAQLIIDANEAQNSRLRERLRGEKRRAA